MFYSEIEVGARELLNDVGGPTQRYSRANLISWMTQALRLHALHRPDLFSAEGEMVAAGADAPFRADRILQSAPTTGENASIRLMDVLEYRAAGSQRWTAVNLVDYAQMVDQGIVSRGTSQARRTIPRGILFGGSDDDTVQARPEWARRPKNPNGFVFTPAPPRGSILRIEFARVPPATPPNYDQTTVVPYLSDAYSTTMIHCVVWLAESVNDRSVVSGRAQMYQTSFLQALVGEMEARVITDDPSEGEEEEGGG